MHLSVVILKEICKTAQPCAVNADTVPVQPCAVNADVCYASAARRQSEYSRQAVIVVPLFPLMLNFALSRLEITALLPASAVTNLIDASTLG